MIYSSTIYCHIIYIYSDELSTSHAYIFTNTKHSSIPSNHITSHLLVFGSKSVDFKKSGFFLLSKSSYKSLILCNLDLDSYLISIIICLFARLFKQMRTWLLPWFLRKLRAWQVLQEASTLQRFGSLWKTK